MVGGRGEAARVRDMTRAGLCWGGGWHSHSTWGVWPIWEALDIHRRLL